MSDEGRRVLKMETILALFAGKAGGEVSDLVSFLTKRSLSSSEEAVAAPLCKAWLCSQLPGLLESRYDESAIYGDWIKKECARLGADNVSVPPIDDANIEPIAGVLDMLAANKASRAEQTETIANLEGQVAALTPFKDKTAALEKKAADLQGKVEGLEKEVANLKKEAAQFKGKVPINEKEIESAVKDIVQRAVASIAVVAPGAAGEAAAAPAADDGATAAPPDDFGFGASGAGGDGFGF